MTTANVDLKEITELICELRQKAERLKEISGNLQCIDKNCDRILAGVLMLELNITDVREFLE